MAIQPYLFFEGRCDEAIAFYKKAAGAEVQMLMRFKDAPADPKAAAETADKVMHACLRINGANVMMSDGRCGGKPSFQGFALSLDAADEAQAKKLFGALNEGGQTMMPLGKTFFSPCFGMTTDKFGVLWMVIVEPKA